MKKGRTVLQAKRYGIYHCRANARLRDITQTMVEKEINTMPVVDDEGYLVGVLTRTDLLRAYTTHEDWGSHTAGQHMHREVITVTPQTLLSDAAIHLLNHHIHQVIVVEEEHGRQRPVAIISTTDLVYHMLKED